MKLAYLLEGRKSEKKRLKLAYLLEQKVVHHGSVIMNTGEQEIAEGEDASLLFRPPKRTRSAVWDFFGSLKDEYGEVLVDGMPTCKRCKRKVPCKAANTSNIAYHLREKLPQEHAKIVKSTVRLANICDR